MSAGLPPSTALADVVGARALGGGTLTPPLRVLHCAGRPVCGPAVTVLLEPRGGDPGLAPLYDLLSTSLPGAVLVVAGADGAAGAVFGQILARAAARCGVVAAVVDGPVRDLALLPAEGVSVAGRTEMTRGAVGLARVAAVRVPVSIAGVAVEDGDLVVVDEGGAVALPSRVAATLLEDAGDLQAAEARVLADLAGGVPLRSAYLHKRTVTERLGGALPLAASQNDHHTGEE